MKGKHEWTEDDEKVLIYLLMYGITDFPYSLGQIGDILGVGEGSMKERMESAGAYAQSRILNHVAHQTRAVYDRYKLVPRSAFREEVKKILEKAGLR